MTEGDNRNIMAAQLAIETFRVEQVDRQDQRSAAGPGLRRAGDRHDLPDRPDGRRVLSLPRLPVPSAGVVGPATTPPSREPAIPRRRHPRPDRRSSAGRRHAHVEPLAAIATARPRAERPSSGGLSRVRARRRRRQGRLLPGQGALELGPRGRAHGEGPRAGAARSPTRSARSSSPTTAARASTSAEAGCNRADIVAAVTGDDEDNLVICQMAKHHFDVPRTIARVNNPKNEELFRHLGVDEIISPTRMVLGSIEQDIPVHELLHLAALGERRARAHRGAPPAGLAGRRASAARPRDARRLLAVRGRPRRRGDPAPARHGPAPRATRSSRSATPTARLPSTSSSSGRRPMDRADGSLAPSADRRPRARPGRAGGPAGPGRLRGWPPFVAGASSATRAASDVSGPNPPLIAACSARGWIAACRPGLR